ncbi:MAG: CCA tRNA nucleotidyltransferase [Proteobacteria bacterium]|nr:CCA tRNA nucleotidyltransferase [Pseudomonadota bacterium]
MRPAGKLGPQPWMQSREVRLVVGALTAKRQTVRFVGGCVRDSVVQREFREVDIATPDDPGTVSDLLAAAGLKAIPTGIAHGTVSAISGGRTFEITTLRVDTETTGRHATVAFTDDWAADAARRDFTVNALYADPDGTLYDPTGGLPDLNAGRIRFVGNASARIAEDYLRILRFFRFFAYYGSPPANAEAMAACREHASGIARLSGERIAHELLRLLGAAAPAAVVQLMHEAGVLDRIAPEATDFARLAHLSRRDGDDPDPVRRLAALLRAEPEAIRARAEVLRLSNRNRDRLAGLAALPPVSPTADERVLRRALYAVGREKFRDDVYLRWAEDAIGTHPGWREVLTFPDRWTPPVFPLGGDDALALGLNGAAVGAALAAVEAWWIGEDFTPDRAACLDRLGAEAA